MTQNTLPSRLDRVTVHQHITQWSLSAVWPTASWMSEASTLARMSSGQGSVWSDQQVPSCKLLWSITTVNNYQMESQWLLTHHVESVGEQAPWDIQCRMYAHGTHWLWCPSFFVNLAGMLHVVHWVVVVEVPSLCEGGWGVYTVCGVFGGMMLQRLYH